MSNLSIIDLKGDIKIEWDAGNEEEVEYAREAFDCAKEKGFMAFKMKDGIKGKVIKKFDKKAESILMTPPMVGG